MAGKIFFFFFSAQRDKKQGAGDRELEAEGSRRRQQASKQQEKPKWEATCEEELMMGLWGQGKWAPYICIQYIESGILVYPAMPAKCK